MIMMILIMKMLWRIKLWSKSHWDTCLLFPKMPFFKIPLPLQIEEKNCHCTNNGWISLVSLILRDPGGLSSFQVRTRSPWGYCIITPVPNGCNCSGFWLGPENICVFLPNHSEAWLIVLSWVSLIQPCLLGPFDEGLLEEKSFGLNNIRETLSGKISLQINYSTENFYPDRGWFVPGLASYFMQDFSSKHKLPQVLPVEISSSEDNICKQLFLSVLRYHR